MKKILVLSVLLASCTATISLFSLDGESIVLAPEGGDIGQPVDRGGPGDQGGGDRNNGDREDQGGLHDGGDVLAREGARANQGSGAKAGGAGADGGGRGVQVVNGAGDGGSVNTTDMSQQILPTMSQAARIEGIIHSGQEAPTQNALPELSSNGQEVVTTLTKGIEATMKGAKGKAIDTAITALERFEQFHDSTSPERALLDVLKRVKSFLEVSADEKQSMLDGLNRDIDVAKEQHLGLADVLKKIKNFVNKESKKKLSTRNEILRIEDEEGYDGFKTPNISESDAQNILKNIKIFGDSGTSFTDDQLKNLFVELDLEGFDLSQTANLENLEQLGKLLEALKKAKGRVKSADFEGHEVVNVSNRPDIRKAKIKKTLSIDNELQQKLMMDFLDQQINAIEKAYLENNNEKQLTSIENDINGELTNDLNDCVEILKNGPVTSTAIGNVKAFFEGLKDESKKLFELIKIKKGVRQLDENKIDELKAQLKVMNNALPDIENIKESDEFIQRIGDTLAQKGSLSLADIEKLQKLSTWQCVSIDGKTQFKSVTDFIQNKVQELIARITPAEFARSLLQNASRETLLTNLFTKIPGEGEWSSGVTQQLHEQALKDLKASADQDIKNDPTVQQMIKNYETFDSYQKTANKMLADPSIFSRADVDSLQKQMNELLNDMNLQLKRGGSGKGLRTSLWRDQAGEIWLKQQQIDFINGIKTEMDSLVNRLKDPTIASQFGVIPKPKSWSFSNPVKALWNRYLKWAYGKDSQTVTPIEWDQSTNTLLDNVQNVLENKSSASLDQLSQLKQSIDALVKQGAALDAFVKDNPSKAGKMLQDQMELQFQDAKLFQEQLVPKLEHQTLLAKADVAQFDALTPEKRLALLIQTPESALNFLLCMEKSQPTILKNVKNGYVDFLGKWSNDSTWGDNPIENRTKLQQMVDEFQKSYSQNASITNLSDTFTPMVSSADLMFDESKSGKPITDIVEQIDPRKFTNEKLIDFMNHFLIEGKLKNAISFEENQKSVATLAGGNAKSVLESLYFQGGTLVDAGGNPITVENQEFLTVAKNFIQNFTESDVSTPFSDIVQVQCLKGENLSIFHELAHFQEVQFRAQQIALPSGNEIRTEQEQRELIKQTQIYRDLTSQFLNDQLAFMFVEKNLVGKKMVTFSPLQKQVVSASLFDMMRNSNSESGQEIQELQDQITELITSKMQEIGVIQVGPAQAPRSAVIEKAPGSGITKKAPEVPAEASGVVEGA